MFKVAFIVGSVRKDSSNRKLALALSKLGRGRFESSFVQIDDLPLFNPDLEQALPPPVVRLKSEIEAADAVIFLTPEYLRSVPAILKNVVEWGARPYGRNSWAGKVGAVAGASPGAIGTAVAQRELRSLLSLVDVALMGQPEVYITFKPGLIDAEGNVTDETTKQFLQGFVDRFNAWTDRLSGRSVSAAAA